MTESRTGAALSALLFAGALFASCSPSAPESLSNKTQTIAGGEEAPLENAVFFVEVTTPLGTAVCSATLVTPDLLLTAAHCLTAQFGPVDCDATVLEEALEPEKFRVSNVADLTGPADPSWTFPDVASVHLAQSGVLLCGNDVGLIQLASPIEDVSPMDVPHLGAQEGSYFAMGYGAVHPSGTGEGVRRTKGPLPIQCASPEECDSTTLMGGASGASTIPATKEGEFVGGAGLCPGDSGGPALVASSDGTDAGNGVIGVLSRGHSDCSLSIYSEPQSPEFRALVREIVTGPGSTIDYPLPAWALEPEDPSTEPTPSVGGAGGYENEGGSPGKGPPEGSDTEPAEGANDNGCGCRLVKSSPPSVPGSPVLVLLLSFLLWGARRRRTKAARLPSPAGKRVS